VGQALSKATTFSLAIRIARFYTTVVTSCTVTISEHVAHV